MKKVKNVLKEIDSLPVQIKEVKIKKKKPKNVKKFKDAGGKTDLNLAPKILSPRSNPKNRNANKEKSISEKQVEQIEFKGEDRKVTNDKSKADKQKEIKSKINKQTNSSAETPAEQPTVTKIVAQKLSKQKEAENELNKTLDAKTNVQKIKELDTTDATKTVAAMSSKVLSKKEKNAAKRKLIRDQKLDEKQTRNPAVEACTIFVGNLPVNTKRVQLIRLFEDFGPVSSIRIRSAGGKVLFKHKQRLSAGALNAYMVLKDKETAEKAVSLNGVEFKGRHLRVTLAAKNPQSHEKEEAKRTVFIGNLKYSATEESLREIFSSCGEIDYIRCLRDGDKGCKGVAFACFKAADAVGLALELNGTIVDERPINVERYSVKKLGAKEAREAREEKEQKSKLGAKQRIDSKKGKKEKSGNENNNGSRDDAKKPKKSEFRGVKVESMKKKQKSKKKKSNDQMLHLAKKIAPKIKTE